MWNSDRPKPMGLSGDPDYRASRRHLEFYLVQYSMPR